MPLIEVRFEVVPRDGRFDVLRWESRRNGNVNSYVEGKNLARATADALVEQLRRKREAHEEATIMHLVSRQLSRAGREGWEVALRAAQATLSLEAEPHQAPRTRAWLASMRELAPLGAGAPFDARTASERPPARSSGRPTRDGARGRP